MCLSLVRCKLFWVVNGNRTHGTRNHNPTLYLLSYNHHVSPVCWVRTNLKSDMSQFRSPRTYGSNAEDIGIEPNTRRYISLSRRTLSPSRFIFRSRHSRNRTYMGPINLSTAYQTEGICAVFGGTGRTRTYNLLINSQVLRQLRYCSFCCGSRWNRTTKPMFYRHEQDPADTPIILIL
jgi:hypothetical protein